jgi:hypothetical protein
MLGCNLVAFGIRPAWLNNKLWRVSSSYLGCSGRHVGFFIKEQKDRFKEPEDAEKGSLLSHFPTLPTVIEMVE